MTGKIYITGQIGDFDNQKGTNLIDIISQVKGQPEALAFDVYINSEGGIVDVGFDIHDYLRSLNKPITTIGNGLVASIASVVFLAGDDRKLMDNTKFMIHMPWGSVEGDSETISGYAKMLESYEKRMLDFYKKALALEEEALRPLLREETWLSAEQLTTLGFTTSVLMPAVAKAKIVNPKQENMNLNDKDRHWMESLFERVLGKFKKPVAKVVQDATGAELDFGELAEDAAIEVGATATVDGNPADGEYTMPNGEVYVFTAGELTEIREAGGGEGSEELDTANARIAELESENEALAARATTAEETLATVQKDVLALKAQVMSKFKPEGKKPAASHQKPGDDRTAGMKEYLTNKRK